jgi:D-glycero-D-manno-heptose 1,7-bisphosphate phosphatase
VYFAWELFDDFGSRKKVNLMLSQPAIFLDRDGVINKNVFYHDTQEWESPRTPREFEFIEGAVNAIQRLHQADYALFIVTNQPSYAKGKTTLEDLKDILDDCVFKLKKAAIPIVHAYCSYSHPQSIIPALKFDCPYRKPSPGALLQAARDYNLDLKASWMIGDRETDIECGHKAGVRTIRVAPDYQQSTRPNSPLATKNALNIVEAVDLILAKTIPESTALGN